MATNGRLRELQDGAELPDRELAPIEKKEDPTPRGIGEGANAI
jgi:hypothetical protein